MRRTVMTKHFITSPAKDDISKYARTFRSNKTYNEKEVPRTNEEYLTLDYTDIQLYYKRVRKKEERKVKHLTVGEYGTENLRPHYHAIVFNAHEDILYNEWTRKGKGHAHFDSVNTNTMLYTLKYFDKQTMSKKFREVQNPDKRYDYVKKEFRRMSNGLGGNFIYDYNPSTGNWDKPNSMYRKILDEELYTVCTDEGVMLPLPEYYIRQVHGEEYKYKSERARAYINAQIKLEEHQRKLEVDVDKNKALENQARVIRHVNSQKANKRRL